MAIESGRCKKLGAVLFQNIGPFSIKLVRIDWPEIHAVRGSRIEGSKTLIKKENLFASNLRDDRLEIELTEAPKHGNLRLINFNKEPVLNITRIKGEYIFKGSVHSRKKRNFAKF